MTQPQLWVFCGTNGAGKTTLYRRFFDKEIDYVNPDNMKIAIQSENPHLTDNALQIQAARQALTLRSSLVENRKTFVFETTLSGNSEITLIKKTKELGYKINLIYVGLSGSLQSLARVKTRVNVGGHDVPVEAILRRYGQSMNNFVKIAPLADRLFIFDNSGKKHRSIVTIKSRQVSYRSKRLPEWYKKIANAIENAI
ncbi:MAG: zeta toxin family protein [Pelistega sp.]|nr:zeta toxin family protein [Pelistega sp.]